MRWRLPVIAAFLAASATLIAVSSIVSQPAKAIDFGFNF